MTDMTNADMTVGRSIHTLLHDFPLDSITEVAPRSQRADEALTQFCNGFDFNHGVGHRMANRAGALGPASVDQGTYMGVWQAGGVHNVGRGGSWLLTAENPSVRASRNVPQRRVSGGFAWSRAKKATCDPGRFL